MHEIYINHYPKKLFFGNQKYFVLTTRKIYKKCKFFFETTPVLGSKTKLIYVPDGEKFKNKETAWKVLEILYKNKASKNDNLLCLGGGMITDLGGFCASVYKRGLRLIHIPTTLLAMVDASIGGKNGLNFHHAKNIIGTTYFPDSVIVMESFLSTLSPDELMNGLSEIFKISLVSDSKFYYRLCDYYYKKNISKTIKKAIELKRQITEKDPFDKTTRKVLNFGHTLGHAIEACYQDKNKNIPHGKAVSTGMVLEIFLSYIKGYLNEVTANDIINNLRKHLVLMSGLPAYAGVYHYMLQDKKNSRNKILCIGLKQTGKPVLDMEISRRELEICWNLYSLWIKQ